MLVALAFLLGGNMCCGIIGDELMVRVGPAAYERAVVLKHARPMDFTGKPLRGMVYVAREGLVRKSSLQKWVQRGVDYADKLPVKSAKRRPRR